MNNLVRTIIIFSIFIGCGESEMYPQSESTPSFRDAQVSDHPSLSAPAKVIGFNLTSWWNFGDQGETVWKVAIQDLYDHGLRLVLICPLRFFDPNSGAFETSSPKAPELTHLAPAISLAKSLGMTVVVNPFIAPKEFAFWRGDWNPEPGSAVAARFWADYQTYIKAVAVMAEYSGADRLTIGSELKSITHESGQNAQLKQTIDVARSAFSRALGYAANWDEFQDPNLTSVVWDHPEIHFIGVDAYFQLATIAQADASGSHPDAVFIQNVKQSWIDLLDEKILPFAQARKNGKGMPVFFTEHGLIPFNRTTVKPYAQESGFSQPIEPAEQVNGYQALLEALAIKNIPSLEVYFWHWGMPGAYDSFWYTHPEGKDQKPGSKFDESLGNQAGRFLCDVVKKK